MHLIDRIHLVDCIFVQQARAQNGTHKANCGKKLMRNKTSENRTWNDTRIRNTIKMKCERAKEYWTRIQTARASKNRRTQTWAHMHITKPHIDIATATHSPIHYDYSLFLFFYCAFVFSSLFRCLVADAERPRRQSTIVTMFGRMLLWFIHTVHILLLWRNRDSSLRYIEQFVSHPMVCIWYGNATQHFAGHHSYTKTISLCIVSYV